MVSSGRVHFRDRWSRFHSAGKTTLSERLSTRLDATLVLEETEDPYLSELHANAAAPSAQRRYLLNRDRQQTILKQAHPRSDHDFRLPVRQGQIFATIYDNELFIYQ